MPHRHDQRLGLAFQGRTWRAFSCKVLLTAQAWPPLSTHFQVFREVRVRAWISLSLPVRMDQPWPHPHRRLHLRDSTFLGLKSSVRGTSLRRPQPTTLPPPSQGTVLVCQQPGPSRPRQSCCVVAGPTIITVITFMISTHHPGGKDRRRRTRSHTRVRTQLWVRQTSPQLSEPCPLYSVARNPRLNGQEALAEGTCMKLPGSCLE